MKKLLIVFAAGALLAGCGTLKSDRAITGGAMGAGIGLLGGPAGALAGGAIGAGVGVLTPADTLNLGRPFWRRGRVVVGGIEPGAPDLVMDDYGYSRASFSNACTVYYDNRGARISYSGPCTNQQMAMADQSMAVYRQNQPQSPLAPYAYPSTPAPTYPTYPTTPANPAPAPGAKAYIDSVGYGHVVFSNNNCLVFFDTSGRRTSNLESCSAEQIRQADATMAAFRREKGLR